MLTMTTIANSARRRTRHRPAAAEIASGPTSPSLACSTELAAGSHQRLRLRLHLFFRNDRFPYVAQFGRDNFATRGGLSGTIPRRARAAQRCLRATDLTPIVGRGWRNP